MSRALYGLLEASSWWISLNAPYRTLTSTAWAVYKQAQSVKAIKVAARIVPILEFFSCLLSLFPWSNFTDVSCPRAFCRVTASKLPVIRSETRLIDHNDVQCYTTGARRRCCLADRFSKYFASSTYNLLAAWLDFSWIRLGQLEPSNSTL